MAEDYDIGGAYFDVPGGISNEYQFNPSLEPYNYAPVRGTMGVGSLNPIGYDPVSYDDLSTSYEELRGIGTSIPYGYDQYLSWGPGAYMTEIVTGYDINGEPIIERPGSSIPLAGHDDVPGYNWDLLPEHGPFYTDYPLEHPGPDATVSDFTSSGIADIDRGIPGVLLHDYPTLRYGASGEPYMPGNVPDFRYQYGVNEAGLMPAADLAGGSWEWDPSAARFQHLGGQRGNTYENVYGNWIWHDRYGNRAGPRIGDTRPETVAYYNRIRQDYPDVWASMPTIQDAVDLGHIGSASATLSTRDRRHPRRVFAWGH